MDSLFARVIERPGARSRRAAARSGVRARALSSMNLLS